MIENNSIIEEVNLIIQTKYGQNTLMKFLKLQKSILGGKDLEIESTLPPLEQIKELNIFWKKVSKKFSIDLLEPFGELEQSNIENYLEVLKITILEILYTLEII